MRALAVLCLLLVGCSSVDDILTRDESPVDSDESYLSLGGTQTQLDLGPDQKSLLEEYRTMRATKLDLEKKLGDSVKINEDLRRALDRTTKERDEANRMRAGEASELARLRRTLHDRDARVLTLSLERSRSEQEALELRIAAARNRLETLQTIEGAPATPPGSGR